MFENKCLIAIKTFLVQTLALECCEKINACLGFSIQGNKVRI